MNEKQNKNILLKISLRLIHLHQDKGVEVSETVKGSK